MYLFTLWKRRYDMCTVVPCCHSHFFVCTEKRTKMENYKTMENCKTVSPKSYRGPRGPLLKYRRWNKPCSRFDKAPETRSIGNEIRKTTTSGTQGTKKAVAVAKERSSYAGGYNYRALTGKVLLVCIGGCSLTRGGRTWRFGRYTFFRQFMISVR